MTTTQPRTPESSFTRRVTFGATAAKVFAAITTLEGLRGWWTPYVSGDAAEGGDVRFEFEGLSGQHIIMHVDQAKATSTVKWTCYRHSALPEWKATNVTWALRPIGLDRCELLLEHVGLTPQLECYDHCEVGWDHFLASIAAYVERGAGMPYRGSGSGVCGRSGSRCLPISASALER